jgi:hypothetical protein
MYYITQNFQNRKKKRRYYKKKSSIALYIPIPGRFGSSQRSVHASWPYKDVDCLALALGSII